jgi:ferrous iron transport protein A
MTEGLRLNELKPGEGARIHDVEGNDAVAMRLMEMGLTDGEEIKCIGFAPLGDPIEYLVRGYRVSLRKAEARRIRVEVRG